MDMHLNPQVTPLMVVKLTKAFQRYGISHCFLGHLAVNYWGYHRGFSQLELLISGNSRMHSRVVQAIRDLGITEQIPEMAFHHQIIRIITSTWFIDIYTHTNDGKYLIPQMIRWVELESAAVPVLRLRPLISHMKASGDHYPESEYAIELSRIHEILRTETRPLNARKFLGN